ncbi:MAG: ATP-binding protein [Pseudomonadota bacterium]
MPLDYAALFEQMPCYLTVQDKSHALLAANTRFVQDFGSIEGRTCYQVYKQRSEPCEQCPVQRSFDDGRPHRSEQQVIALDGQPRTMIVFTQPIRNGTPEVAQVLELSADITEIKALELQLRDSKQRLRALFDEVPCYVSIQDPELNVVEANQRFKTAFGSCLGLKCFEVYKHRDEECMSCPVQQTFVDGRLHHSEEVVTSQQGEQIHTLVTTAPLLDEAGHIVQVMEMSADITPIRRLQSQLESIGLLISSISHGIKGLLTGLDGGIYMVNSALNNNKPERMQQGWQMVLRNVDRIRSMVLNILYYAREREPQYEAVDLKGLLDEVAEVMHPKACEHNTTFQIEVASSSGALLADPRALRALIVNLAENSVDACRVDSKKDSHVVQVRAQGTSSEVQIVVEDNGIGMDRETREKAFSLFFSSKGHEGTGLGLFISNTIARAHGGRIEVDSEPERGTCFRVLLPRAHAAVAKGGA